MSITDEALPARDRLKKHTPEPWEVRNLSKDTLYIMGPDGWNVSVMSALNDDEIENNTRANARRIVECVNACAGMKHPGKTLEQITQLLIGCAQFMQHYPDGFELAEKIATLIEGIDERKSNHEKH